MRFRLWAMSFVLGALTVSLAGCVSANDLAFWRSEKAPVAESRAIDFDVDQAVAQRAADQTPSNADEIEGRVAQSDYPSLQSVPSRAEAHNIVPQDAPAPAPVKQPKTIIASQNAIIPPVPAPNAAAASVMTPSADVEQRQPLAAMRAEDSLRPQRAAETPIQHPVTTGENVAAKTVKPLGVIATAPAPMSARPEAAPRFAESIVAPVPPSAIQPMPVPAPMQTPNDWANEPAQRPSVPLVDVYGQKLAESFASVSTEPVGLGVLEWQRTQLPLPPSQAVADRRFVGGNVVTGRSQFAEPRTVPNVQPTIGTVATLYFLPTEASLTPQDFSTLTNVAKLHQQQHRGAVMVTAFTGGKDKASLEVAVQRAENVRRQLVALGIPMKDIKINAGQKSKPGPLDLTGGVPMEESVEVAFIASSAARR